MAIFFTKKSKFPEFIFGILVISQNCGYFSTPFIIGGEGAPPPLSFHFLYFFVLK
jgi:hypothetical protein